MHFWGTSRRNFLKRKILPYCTFSRSTQIWCQNWWFFTLKFYHFKGISKTSLTSMQSIVDARNLKFWENYPKVVLKRNVIAVNCVYKKGDFWPTLRGHNDFFDIITISTRMNVESNYSTLTPLPPLEGSEKIMISVIKCGQGWFEYIIANCYVPSILWCFYIPLVHTVSKVKKNVFKKFQT